MPERNGLVSKSVDTVGTIVKQLPKSPFPTQLLYVLLAVIIMVIALAGLFGRANVPTADIIAICETIASLAFKICLLAGVIYLLRFVLLRHEAKMEIDEHDGHFKIQRENNANRSTIPC